MVKIVKKKLIGKQKVYDIGVSKDHNFILENGLIASNCFNKSHSTAYAYVTYQTAYLKANYPVEYMSALLTASSDSQDKVEKYRENCLKMRIEVVPPNINISNRDFTPKGDKTILFGLSAVKNLGESAIENILQSRQEAGGNFTNFADFMDRINLKTVNRRALETLIYAGAFDCLNNNRRQLIEGLDLMITWTQKKHKEKETGQLNVFEVMSIDSNNEPEKSSTKNNFVNAPTLPKLEDYSTQDKLKSEKEHLGFYVSEHPLKPLQKSAKLLTPINISDLSSQKKRKRICVIAMITNIKKHIDKNNNNMAFLDIEDISGQTDAIVFASNYEQVSEHLVEETPLIIWGKADNKDDKSQIFVDFIKPLEQVKMVVIHLSPDQASEPKLQGKLKGILQEQSGDKNKANVPTFAVINGEKQRIFVRLGDNFWVQSAEDTVKALEYAKLNAFVKFLSI